MPDIKYDYIVFKEDFLNENEISLIDSFAKKLPDEEGTAGKYKETGNIRNSTVRWIKQDPDINWLWEKIDNMVRAVNDNFFHLDLYSHEALQYTIYPAPSGRFASHQDVFFDVLPHRKITFSIQLSDETEYTGGDFFIYEQSVTNPYKASKKKGSLIVFLSLIVHEVTEITTGTRKSLVGWVSGPPLR